MKNIILKELRLTNFKGIKELTVNFEEGLTNIFGDNGTGKTTVFDAYSWLFSDKDSMNNADTNFNIKTIKEDGTIIHNQEHSVEGIFLFDGEEIIFKKIYKEVWTRKKGNIDKEFDRNTTDYFINGLEIRKKDYIERLESVISVEQTQLLSNPMYFSIYLKNDKARRNILFTALKTDLTDEDIFKKNSELRELPLDKFKLDEILAQNKAIATKANKELEELPIRIDELRKNKKEFDFATLKVNRDVVIPAIKRINDEIIHGDNTEELKEVNAEISRLYLEVSEAEREVEAKNRESAGRVRKHNDELDTKLKELNFRKDEAVKTILDTESYILKSNDEVGKYREKYIELARQEYDGSTTCPVCKQDLPEDMIADAQGEFNLNKSKHLEELAGKANALKSNIESQEETKKLLETRIAEISKEIETLENTPRQAYIEVVAGKEVEEKKKQIEELREKLHNNKPVDNNERLAKRDELQKELDLINADLMYEAINKETEVNIKEYEERQKEVQRNYDEASRLVYLCEQYTKTKVDLISDEINNHFKLVSFKLFDELQNGGIVETCEATIDGVPFSDANNASKINAGIDIINTLSKAYGISTPIFVDNAESVNELIETDSQVVRLVVSKDKELKVA